MVDSTLQEDLDPLETREWQDALSAVTRMKVRIEPISF